MQRSGAVLVRRGVAGRPCQGPTGSRGQVTARRRTRCTPTTALFACLPLLALTSGCQSSRTSLPQVRASSPPARLAPSVPPLATPGRTIFGRSAAGRALVAWTVGVAAAPRRVLVIGCIHGDETAGLPFAEDLLRDPARLNVELVVVPDLNPDGVAAHSRQNAHHVDLNRNFPYLWRPLGRPGDQQYAGATALSEPESNAIALLIEGLRPTVTVWFHQPIGVVDLSGGSAAVEREFARVAGMSVRELLRYPGSATGWQNHTFPGTTAFVVELPRQVSTVLRQRVLAALRSLV